jgi:hypothetical protein
MSVVRRDQFDIISDIQVVHKPTGATFSVYRYPDPNVDVCSEMRVNWGRAGDRLENGDEYDRDEVEHVARELLREQARSASKSKR